MDIQDSSIPKPSPEVRIDLSSEDMATDQACQDSCETTIEVHEEGSSQGMATDEASQGGCKITRIMPKPEVNEEYRSLFEAAVKGDWKGAEKILDNDPSAITATLLTTQSGPATVSDIAVMAGQDKLVEILVKRFRTENKDSTLRCALYYAARRGRIRKIKELVDEVGDLDVNLALPIAIENATRHNEVIRYLAKQAKSFPKFDIVLNLIKDDHWDILLDLVKKHPESMNSDESQTLLQLSSYMQSFYHSVAQLNFWEKFIYKCILPSVDTSFDNAQDTNMARVVAVVERAIRLFKRLSWNIATKAGKIIYPMSREAPFIRIGELKLKHKYLLELANLIFKKMKRDKQPSQMLQLTEKIVARAASCGIFETVKLCLEHCPELMWHERSTKQLIEVVVKARNVELFRLLIACNPIRRLMYDLQTIRDLMVAVVEWSPGCVPTDVFGSAFLMQRELQWFEVLEDGCSPLLQSLNIKMKKHESDPFSKSYELEPTERRPKTYWDDFVEKRKDLLQEAGQWMKDTSSSCSLVATLIITITFAAAFTVPGSNDNTGIPIFLKKTSFTVFAVADALALFSSVTATLMFLAILTSRYAPKDFLRSLPRKMILGLTFLFLSLAFMLVAFGSALMIVLSEQWKWIYIPITLLAAVPVILFAILQLPLYVEMVESTYWPRLYRPVKIWK